MAWQVPIANTTASTSLGTADSLYVASPIVIGAVLAAGSNQQAVVDGTIVGSADGLWFSNTGQSGNSATIHEGGVVRGHTSSGVAFYSSDSSLVNKGHVFGGIVGVMFRGTSTTTTSTLNNSGTVESSQYGVARFAGVETVSVTNTGTISGSSFSYGQYTSNPVARDLITNRGTMIGDVDLGAGNDLYDGSGGRLTGKVLGGAGDDVIRGGIDNDNFEGGDGNDFLYGGAGADTMKGGSGNDTYVVDNAGDIVDETGGTGGDTGQSSISFSLANTARAKGSVEHLTLTGSGHINGTGNALANTIIGNSGNNVLDGGKGADRMEGGKGNDTYLIDNVGDRVIEKAGEGTDLVRSSISYTLPEHVENLVLTGSGHINGSGNGLANAITGNAGKNTLKGGGGVDTLKGGGGVDKLYGDAGNDFLYGGASDDQLYGGAGADRLYGDADNDRLFGGTHNDLLYGGTGNDRLYGDAGSDRLYGGRGNDQLYGGAGKDYAYFSGRASDYTITESGSRTIVAHRDGRGIDGTDTLIGVEFMVFSDQTIAV